MNKLLKTLILVLIAFSINAEELKIGIVDVNKILYENNFELIRFSEYRFIGLYKNKQISI